MFFALLKLTFLTSQSAWNHCLNWVTLSVIPLQHNVELSALSHLQNSTIMPESLISTLKALLISAFFIIVTIQQHPTKQDTTKFLGSANITMSSSGAFNSPLLIHKTKRALLSHYVKNTYVFPSSAQYYPHCSSLHLNWHKCPGLKSWLSLLPQKDGGKVPTTCSQPLLVLFYEM